MNLQSHTFRLLSIAALLPISSVHAAVSAPNVANNGLTFSAQAASNEVVTVTYTNPADQTTTQLGTFSHSLGRISGQLNQAFNNGQTLTATTASNSLPFQAPDAVNPVLSNSIFASPTQITTDMSEPGTVNLYAKSAPTTIVATGSTAGSHRAIATNATLALNAIRDGRWYELEAEDMEMLKSSRVDIQAPQPTINTRASFSVASVKPGESAQLSLQITGDQTANQRNMQLQNAVPGPLTVSAVASNSCQGSASVNGNQLTLTDGIVPATPTGCTVVLEVTWPASDNCSVNQVSNTFAPNANLQFTDPETLPGGPTLHANGSSAALTCIATAVTPPVTPGNPGAAGNIPPVPVGGLGFLLLSGLGLLGAAFGVRRARS